MTCSQVPRPLDSLLLMSMKERETLKNYLDRYWEIYNEINEDFEDVAIRTFKVGLLTHSNLWKSLTMKPLWNMHQLVDQIEVHKRVEDNQNKGKGKAMAFTPDQKDNSVGWFNPSQLRREFFKQVPHKPTRPQRVSSVFKEPIYRVLEKKNQGQA